MVNSIASSAAAAPQFSNKGKAPVAEEKAKASPERENQDTVETSAVAAQDAPQISAQLASLVNEGLSIQTAAEIASTIKDELTKNDLSIANNDPNGVSALFN